MKYYFLEAMKMKCGTKMLVLAMLLVAFAGISFAEIVVENPSFDEDDVGTGSYTYNWSPWKTSGWSWIGNGYYGGAPEGDGWYVITAGTTWFQDLSATFTEGETINFSIDVGTYDNGAQAGDNWTIFLYDATVDPGVDYEAAPTSILAAKSGLLSDEATPLGVWYNKTVSYTATEAVAGHTIGIGFVGDYYTLFDHAEAASSVYANAIYPPDESPGIDPAVTFEWAPPSGYTVTSYDLEYRGDPNFASSGTVSVTGLTGTTHTVSPDLDFDAPYYWRITSYGDIVPHTSPVWGFATKKFDANPLVEAGDNILTTLEMASPPNSLAMGGSVTDDGTSTLTINGWKAFEALGGGLTTKVTFADAYDPETTATISEVGTYILKLTATDATGSFSSQKEIVVYADACDAAKATGARTANYYDRNDDCIVDMEDFAVFAAEWLDSTALTEGWIFDGDFGDPENALIAEYWTGIDGSDPNDLLDAEAYPNTPDGAYFVTGELRSSPLGDSYGQRI
ncbi:MAG: fibronectin type III domain-containing protein, partial [Anaerohalosphaera sp.]|nr:fibronectin type III domain-containing protein [Anaerohalosphaera sp.]